MISWKKSITGAVIIASLSLLTACEQQQQAAPQPPVPSVDVATVISQKITDSHELSGRLQSPQTVQVRPRVSGYIETVNFKEGAIVKPGELLFVIDKRPFSGEVKRLEALLADAKSQQGLAEREYRRAEKLQQQKAIAEDIFDSRASQVQQAKARVASVQASLELAQLNLQFTRVTAPIAGKVSNALITKGNYVNAGQSLLTTLVSTDKLYAYFDADEHTYLSYVNSIKNSDNPNNTVYLRLSTDTEYTRVGVVDFFDNQVDQTTGTIRGRAVFDNHDASLIPGLFVRIKLMEQQAYDGILIDDKAVGTDLNNKFVLVLDEQNQAQYRPITLGDKFQGLRVVKSGLQANDTIVVNGLQRVRPGGVVNPQTITIDKPDTLLTLKNPAKATKAIGQL